MSPVIAFGAMVYRVAFKVVMSKFQGDRELAHDSAVETWLAAFKKGPQAFSGRADLNGFVLFRAEKIALDLKRRRREISGCGLEIEKVTRDEEGDRMREQARHELAKAMTLLPPLDRQIIGMYYFDEMSDRYISARLIGDSASEGAGLKRVNRQRRAAVRQLRPRLEESGLDWGVAIRAFASSHSNRRRSMRRRALPAEPPGVSHPTLESDAA